MEQYHGLRYWQYTLTEETMPLDEFIIKDYGVLLPKLGCDLQGIYTMITKNWSTEMFGEYDFEIESNNYLNTTKFGNMPQQNDYDSVLGGEWI